MNLAVSIHHDNGFVSVNNLFFFFFSFSSEEYHSHSTKPKAWCHWNIIRGWYFIHYSERFCWNNASTVEEGGSHADKGSYDWKIMQKRKELCERNGSLSSKEKRDPNILHVKEETFCLDSHLFWVHCVIICRCAKLSQNVYSTITIIIHAKFALFC